MKVPLFLFSWRRPSSRREEERWGGIFVCGFRCVPEGGDPVHGWASTILCTGCKVSKTEREERER